MGDLFQTPDEMYSEYLLFFKCMDIIMDSDRIINNTYEYLLWSSTNKSKLYKLHFGNPLIGVKNIPKEDYTTIETHYQYLKLKYG